MKFLLVVRTPLLSSFRLRLLSREIVKCQTKADKLGFGVEFRNELAVMIGTAIPGDVSRLFGRMRDFHVQQGKWL